MERDLLAALEVDHPRRNEAQGDHVAVEDQGRVERAANGGVAGLGAGLHRARTLPQNRAQAARPQASWGETSAWRARPKTFFNPTRPHALVLLAVLGL